MAITSYQSGQYDQDEGFKNLDTYISKFENDNAFAESSRHRIFYMGKCCRRDLSAYKQTLTSSRVSALPPSVFIPVSKGLKKNTYSPNSINRLVVEKPFGMDSESSDHLARELGALFREEEVSIGQPSVKHG